ncbi:MAG: division/cell wall cluster transcriptional repressor MraZ [Clostridia bacterium]
MKGEYYHSIDAKGRMIIPNKLRDELGENLVVTRGFDGCLYVYSEENWQQLENQIKLLPQTKRKTLERFVLSKAVDCSLDSQGRILIPATLRTFASLTKDVAIIGVLERAEIWDKEKWDEYNDTLSPEEIEKAMEDIGF